MYGTAWKKEKTTDLVKLAVKVGFTAIDTANQLRHYDEARVGEALLAVYKNGIKREDLFIQTKFTPLDGQGNTPPYDPRAGLTSQVEQSFESSLKHLHTDVIDSYVLHGPYGQYGLTDEDWEVWTAIERLYNEGKVRMIGISNVNSKQLSMLCQKAKVKPMMVQNRCYASRGWDAAVREVCREHNIIYQGFSLLTANTAVFTTDTMRDIMQKTGGTVAQIVFRFAMDVGMLPLTGTTDEQHMREDLSARNLKLSPEDIAAIEHLYS